MIDIAIGTCPAGIVFDGNRLLILIFLAQDKTAIQRAQCDVQCFIISFDNPYIRYVLFRTVAQQLRRSQAQSAPQVRLDGYTRKFEYWPGNPYFVDASNRIYQVHPNGYSRSFDVQDHAWYWVDRDGNTVVDGNGHPVWDTTSLFAPS
jgi:hypothetical protein